jgi:hypothetical protein
MLSSKLAAVVAVLKQEEHGFKHIVEAGNRILEEAGQDAFKPAAALVAGDSYQERMLGVHLLGCLAPENEKALQLLTAKVVNDDNWRVQEMLAKAIDHYCKTTGYEKSLPEIRKWLKAPHPNLNRAVVEGLRIWTSRPYFKEHPQTAIDLISSLRSHESEYLRKSVGNALRDISRKHPELVREEIKTWDRKDAKVAFTLKRIS